MRCPSWTRLISPGALSILKPSISIPLKCYSWMKVKVCISLSSISPVWFNWSRIKNASEAIDCCGDIEFPGLSLSRFHRYCSTLLGENKFSYISGYLVF